jgi:hypothetical protein
VWTFGMHARDAWLRYSTVLEPNTPLQYAGHLGHPCNIYNPNRNFAEYQRCLRVGVLGRRHPGHRGAAAGRVPGLYHRDEPPSW